MKESLNRLHKALLLLRTIPKGKVVTYKELARASGTSPRAVGQILRNNPRPDLCPCYKVIRSDGRVGGFMGETQGAAIRKKISLLRKDHVSVTDGRVDSVCLWRFRAQPEPV